MLILNKPGGEYMKYFCTFILIFVFIFTAFTIHAENNIYNNVDEQNNLHLSNDYIVIVVNQDENAQGRFAVETTGGAPFRTNDDYKPLIYGRPKPWTSYTTIKIDGKNYVFGGSTERRAGGTANYGEIIQQPTIINNTIQTTSQIKGLNIKQLLTFVKSSTTGLYDTAQIKYRIKNESDEEKNVGLRIMLDTMLGKNDGAPFRVGNEAITSDQMYLKEELPEFWQAFDSISSPHVTSQGTFKGPSVTAPDKVYFADWGSMADGAWNFNFNPGEKFIRKGEYEIDSAIALFWEPGTLAPGEEKTYITSYGLGGITIVPGLISMGVTSPAEVTFSRDKNSFPIIAYLENTSEITAREVELKLDIPVQFTVENMTVGLGDMKAGSIAQYVWHVSPARKEIPAKINYTVTVEAANTDRNSVRREVKFVGPPHPVVNIEKIDEINIKLGKLDPNPVKITAQVKNDGGSTLYDAIAEISLPPGLALASREKEKKYLGYIESGEIVDINWHIRMLDIAGTVPFAVDIKGLDEHNDTAIGNLKLPDLDPLIYLEKEESKNYVTLNITGENISDIDSMELLLRYDPEYLKPVYFSRGDIFVKNDRLLPWNEPQLKENNLILIQESIPSHISAGTIASLHFKKIKEGVIPVEFKDYKFYRGESEVDVDIKNF